MNQPKVTVHSATEAPVSAPAASTGLPPGTAIDSKGRKIVAKPLDALEEYRLAKIMGETGDSAWARSIALQAAAVREFEGEPETFPNNDREIEAMVQRLGSEGFEALSKALVDYNAAKPKPNKAAAKN
jgi:hypothetical protein